ncbi:contractile injection system protein, VgrG/Pvc8 family [Pseudomonas sp. P9_31]|uniref:contractile injection system protein, VgrG/Pvc8 family n=1 Tax=Pseudomonas sp. P9_31 TaxID=3043448 RepID=UPI002A36648C|nr:contractile injection system protein, VgrG/Pvc8 family [Pseudomonas sp. P9_31]WPN57366.1 contractile injection system protein, VgrG/Pvc8 family [Pseudomonas sp. P9_31]
MFDPVNEPSFRLDIAGLPDSFEVLAFTGSEAISEPFVFDVDLLNDDPTLDLASLLYRSAFLHFGPPGEGIHGQLLGLAQPGHGDEPRLCRVHLGPRLACLAQRFNQRIFSNRSVPQILAQVLKEHGIAGKDRRFELSGDYPPRDFCTQYRESDLQFLQRLCAQERLHYYFEHRVHGHCLVFGDGLGPFHRGEESVFEGESERPGVHPFKLHGCGQIAEGQTNLATLRSGQLMPLSGHPCADLNRLWLLTHVGHQGGQEPGGSYSNQLRAIAQEVPFVAAYAGVKPRMHSLQRAWVVNVSEPRPDPSRPVAVQFDWLYQGEGAAPSHCWLPLAPELESAGAMPLSEGTQVLVSFIEGDPDQPLISGFLPRPPSSAEPALPDLLSASTTEASRAVDGLLGLLQSSEPLVLLCLLPGGGSFSHCAQSFCTCRAATQLGQSGAA